MRRSPPWRRHSLPVSVEIPAIGVHSVLLRLGDKPDGTMQVPPLQRRPSAAAWYKYSVTPGQIGTSVIEGHVDNDQGPAVFFRLGALRPGDTVKVRLADGITAVFRVTGVRQYPKSKFPAKTVYHAARFAALRLITCGGAFDYATGQYLSSTVVFASLASSRPAGHRKAATWRARSSPFTRIFFLNVPIGAAALLLAPRIVPESRLATARRRYDPFGAVTVTGGLSLLVYAVSTAPQAGWGTARTVSLLAACAALLAAFVVTETRVEAPLMPLRIFRLKTLAGANMVGVQLGGAVGIAIASTIAATHASTLLHQGAAPAAALTSGFHWAFWACGAIGLAAVPVTYLLVRRDELAKAVASTSAKPQPAPADA
jgi:hypothetical protein